MKKIIFTAISLTILPIISMTCSAQEKQRTGGPYYFESFANYKIPFQPIRELTPTEARSHDVYYIAYYNNEGKIISFTKYLHGKMEFSDKYIYSVDGLIERREIAKPTGEIVIQYFDKNGKLIPEK
jgi:hypothetical protein